MYKVGDKVKAPNGDIGTIKSVYEKSNSTAQGYMVSFSDTPMSLFMAEGTVTLVEEPKIITLDNVKNDIEKLYDEEMLLDILQDLKIKNVKKVIKFNTERLTFKDNGDVIYVQLYKRKPTDYSHFKDDYYSFSIERFGNSGHSCPNETPFEREEIEKMICSFLKIEKPKNAPKQMSLFDL